MAGKKRQTASARIRDAIGKLGRPVTQREISAYIGGERLVNNMSSLLGNMASKGMLVRHGSGRDCRFVLGRATLPSGPKPRKQVGAKPPKRATKPASDTAPRPARARDTDCSLVGIPSTSTAARDRIAADLAAFKARGGKIERLGPTQFFRHIGPAHPLRRPLLASNHNQDD